MMDEDEDLAYALYLQEQFDKENSPDLQEIGKSSGINSVSGSAKLVTTKPTSIVDPSWELIDPIPDIRQLFLQFNDEYFDGILASVEVRWSPRMTLCAGLCCYEGRGGLCSIRLSQPLLKLRPRKDLVETLLHEMIHALLFVTQNNKDHDGHGPEFHKHMHRINKQSGTNISVYHNFHDEVDSYRQHWWKCDGPCQKRPPYYGVLRRAMNRAPSPRDPWWGDHQRLCGGTYKKIREPENYNKKVSKAKSTDTRDINKDKGTASGKRISTLDKFLEKRKRENDSSSGEESLSESESKRVRSANEYSDCGSVGAFSGTGHVLGSSSASHNGEKKYKEKAKEGEGQSHGKPGGGEGQLKSDSSGVESDSRETSESCMKTVREKWRAKWESEGKGNSVNGKKFKTKSKGVFSETTTRRERSSTLLTNKDIPGQAKARRNSDLSEKPGSLKNVSPKKSNRTSTSSMKIEEAFKTATSERMNATDGGNIVVSPVLGSAGKPIELLGDSPVADGCRGDRHTRIDLSRESPFRASNGLDLSGESSSSEKNAAALVSCPVCWMLLAESQINGHLDQCLQ